jgi:hypothetical protein
MTVEKLVILFTKNIKSFDEKQRQQAQFVAHLLLFSQDSLKFQSQFDIGSLFLSCATFLERSFLDRKLHSFERVCIFVGVFY